METKKIYGLTPISTTQYYIYFKPKNNYKEELATGWRVEHRKPIYEAEVKLLINCISKRLNEIFDTHYQVDEDYIERAKFKKADTYTNYYLYDWDIKPTYGDKWELINHYWYEGFSKTHIGLDGISTATYGEFTSKDLMESLDNLIKDFKESSFLTI